MNREPEKLVHMSGARGLQFVAHNILYLKDLLPVCITNITHTNIQSLTKGEDIYPITYFPSTSFIINLPIWFLRAMLS